MVVVIGGGVIGMATAYELGSRGVPVTVIDKGDPGHGCSYGNAGWLTPCFSMPLPIPGMLFKSVGWLLDPESPLYIKPEASLLLLRWLVRFLLSMNRKQALRSVAALTEISKFSLEAYAQLNEKFPGSFGFDQKGLLMVSATRPGLKAAITEMDWVSAHGIPGRALSEEDIRAMEPSLRARLAGGVYFPKEAHAEPLQTVQVLRQGAEAFGAKVLPLTEIFEFATGTGKIHSIRTTRGTITADQFVLATGSWSRSLARELGLGVPILGGKGYAITVPKLNPTPSYPIMIVEKKIAVTPRASSLRLAGTLELVNPEDDSITARRVDAILRGAREFLPVPEHPEIIEVWRGLRPCTPDGVPIIGRPSRFSNLVISTGHQMLGLQSALGSARLTADLILSVQPSFDPLPFRADRFV